MLTVGGCIFQLTSEAKFFSISSLIISHLETTAGWGECGDKEVLPYLAPRAFLSVHPSDKGDRDLYRRAQLEFETTPYLISFLSVLWNLTCGVQGAGSS